MEISGYYCISAFMGRGSFKIIPYNESHEFVSTMQELNKKEKLFLGKFKTKGLTNKLDGMLRSFNKKDISFQTSFKPEQGNYYSKKEIEENKI